MPVLCSHFLVGTLAFGILLGAPRALSSCLSPLGLQDGSGSIIPACFINFSSSPAADHCYNNDD